MSEIMIEIAEEDGKSVDKREVRDLAADIFRLEGVDGVKIYENKDGHLTARERVLIDAFRTASSEKRIEVDRLLGLL